MIKMIPRLLLFLVSTLIFADAFTCEAPVSFVEDAVMSMREKLEKSCNVSASEQEIRQMIEDVFMPKVDVEVITKQVLGRQYWQSAAPEDIERLELLMGRLLAMQYGEAFSCEYLDNEMVFHPLRGEVKRYSRVESTVSLSEKESLFLRYAVRCDEGEWKIYDIVIDGLSLAQTYRSQFNRILQQTGPSGLADYLESQLMKDKDDL